MPRRLARRSPELRDIDEHMRGTGRMVRHGHAPLWGPGRHSSGDNVYSYFAGPDNFVVEYTTALERISDEDAWVPRIWPGVTGVRGPVGHGRSRRGPVRAVAPHAAGDRALGAGAGLKSFGYEREPS